MAETTAIEASNSGERVSGSPLALLFGCGCGRRGGTWEGPAA